MGAPGEPRECPVCKVDAPNVGVRMSAAYLFKRDEADVRAKNKWKPGQVYAPHWQWACRACGFREINTDEDLQSE